MKKVFDEERSSQTGVVEVVSVVALYSDDLSSNPAKVNTFLIP